MRAYIAQKIADLGIAEWNDCVSSACPAGDPFLSYNFLNALEVSGCVSERTGWQPFHIILEDRGKLLGAMPTYLKYHSRGEFVFDYGWADALHSIGKRYYPKLQTAVPFTPVTGQRLLVHPQADRASVERELLRQCQLLCEKMHLSSAHITFMTQPEWERAGQTKWLQRIDQQYRWLNKDYGSFDDFLAELPSKKRKNLKRERKDALKESIEIEWVTGNSLTEQHWDVFYEFYLDTGSRKYGSPYLNRHFFSLVSQTMRNQILLVLCRRNGRYIAGALHFIGQEALYGRYWGCIEDHKFLHFEACYYQAIDFAIRHRLSRVEAGAQGGHKFIRGYLPHLTYSAHWITDPRLRRAIGVFLNGESACIKRETSALRARSPYKSELNQAKGIF